MKLRVGWALERFLLAFNRTIEELKLDAAKEVGSAKLTFNRTIEELKLNSVAALVPSPVPFNRTIEELKPVDL